MPGWEGYLADAGFKSIEMRPLCYHLDRRFSKAQRAAFSDYWKSLFLSAAPSLIAGRPRVETRISTIWRPALSSSRRIRRRSSSSLRCKRKRHGERLVTDGDCFQIFLLDVKILQNLTKAVFIGSFNRFRGD